MKFKNFTYYKSGIGFSTLLCYFLLLFAACKDKCVVTQTYRTYTPVYQTTTEIRNAVGVLPAQPLEKIGKIYYRHPYIFVNEVEKGIHIINNQDPSNPINVSFVNIPGNFDMAVQGNILYADNYIDLIALDISNPEDVKVKKRVESVFIHNYNYSADGKNVLVEWKEEMVTTSTPDQDCEGDFYPITCEFMDSKGNRTQLTSGSAINNYVSNNPGIGGSMARFAIANEHLYTISQWEMQVFDINAPENPQIGNKISIGWNIETIFPYQDKLFIGSQSGMHIYDNANPDNPQYLSKFEHVSACDPVVVEGDYAYVTLRSGNECQGFTNQLEVINIKNIASPQLVKTYQMQNPHGLGIDNGTLFICEGSHGLKVFNASNPNNIDQLQNITNIKTTDVIPLGNVLLVIGEDGLYQYDYSNPNNLVFLSKILTEKND